MLRLNYGFVFTANGNIEYSMSKIGLKHIGVVNFNDPNDLFNILNKLTAANELEAVGMFYGTFYENPLNRPFRGELRMFYKDPSHPGYYWSPGTGSDIGYDIYKNPDGNWTIESFHWKLGPQKHN